MKILSAEFVTSAAAGGAVTGIPRDGLPQIAMVGRSNVGKSTLINGLCRRPIARTSAAPGKTRLANIYRVAVEGFGQGRQSVYLVDLPGYGYAKGAARAGDELKAVAEAYFLSRDPGLGPKIGPRAPDPESRVATLLIDSRHPGLESDVGAHQWLTTMGVAPLIVATKIDKLSRAERTRNLKALEKIFGTPALPVSAERGEGMDELWKTILNRARAARTRAADA